MSPASEMGRLDLTDAAKRDGQEAAALIVGFDAVERVFVRVEGDYRPRLVSCGALLPHCKCYFTWKEGQRSEPPRRIAQNGPMPLRECKVELDAVRAVDRRSPTSTPAVQLV